MSLPQARSCNSSLSQDAASSAGDRQHLGGGMGEYWSSQGAGCCWCLCASSWVLTEQRWGAQMRGSGTHCLAYGSFRVHGHQFLLHVVSCIRMREQVFTAAWKGGPDWRIGVQQKRGYVPRESPLEQHLPLPLGLQNAKSTRSTHRPFGDLWVRAFGVLFLHLPSELGRLSLAR